MSYFNKRQQDFKARGRGYSNQAKAVYRVSQNSKARLDRARKSVRRPISAGRRRALTAIANTQTAGFLGIETKFYDTTLSAATIAAATDATGGEYDPSATSMISTPAQGDSEQQRDGKKILIKNVQIKGIVVRPQTEDAVAPPGGDNVFIALVQDMQSNGAQMNSEDCFKNLAATAAGATVPLRNLLYSERFRILKSEMLNMDVPSVSAEGDNLHSSVGVTKCFEWFIPFTDGLPVNFNAGTTASIANVVDNSLHVIAYSNLGVCTLTYNARIRFQG